MQRRQKKSFLYRLYELGEQNRLDIVTDIIIAILWALVLVVHYDDKFVVFICIIALIFAACKYYFNLGAKHFIPEEVKISRDEAINKIEMGEIFILYLRGFYTEGLFPSFYDADGSSRGQQDFVSFNLHDIAPIIAIEGDISTGVAKLRIHDEIWQNEFERKAHKAAVIIVRPFFTPSVIYELQWISEFCAEKTIMIMEPTSLSIDNPLERLFAKIKLRMKRISWGGRWISVKDIWEDVRSNLGDTYKLPKYDLSGAILTFKKHGKLLVVNRSRPFGGESLIEAVAKILK